MIEKIHELLLNYEFTFERQNYKYIFLKIEIKKIFEHLIGCSNPSLLPCFLLAYKQSMQHLKNHSTYLRMFLNQYTLQSLVKIFSAAL